MMKNKIASIFLTLALVLYLLHAIVPHHHHHQLICFNINHLEANCCNDKNHHHRQDEHSSQECCILSVPVVLNDNSKDFKAELQVDQADTHAFDTILASEMDNNVALLLTATFPYYEDYFPDDISSIIICSGLRAPPAV